MEQHEIRLVEEDNTIYEIDMDCIRKKQLAAKRAMEADEKRRLDFEKNRAKSNFYQSLSSVFVLLLISRNRVRRIRTGAAG